MAAIHSPINCVTDEGAFCVARLRMTSVSMDVTDPAQNGLWGTLSTSKAATANFVVTGRA